LRAPNYAESAESRERDQPQAGGKSSTAASERRFLPRKARFSCRLRRLLLAHQPRRESGGERGSGGKAQATVFSVKMCDWKPSAQSRRTMEAEVKLHGERESGSPPLGSAGKVEMLRRASPSGSRRASSAKVATLFSTRPTLALAVSALSFNFLLQRD
jgi:hypothetical protein